MDEDVDSVRVYANIRAGVGHRVISASVAGQIRSLRLNGQLTDADSCNRPSVIEIPLKDSPKSVAVNSSMCNLAVAVQTRVLIYGLSSMKIDGSLHCFT